VLRALRIPKTGDPGTVSSLQGRLLKGETMRRYGNKQVTDEQFEQLLIALPILEEMLDRYQRGDFLQVGGVFCPLCREFERHIDREQNCDNCPWFILFKWRGKSPCKCEHWSRSHGTNIYSLSHKSFTLLRRLRIAMLKRWITWIKKERG
jgi:hypothetical protein